MKKPETIAIVGGGLVGSLLSIYLTRRGYAVTVYERRPDMRKVEIPAGRSINLALSDRGWRALEGVGIDADIRAIGIPMKGRMIHQHDGITFQPYGREGQAIYAVSRGILNTTLLDLAEKSGARLVFNERCTGLSLADNEMHFEHAETGKPSSARADLVFGADGAFSAARMQLQITERYNYSQEYQQHGYKELMFTAGAGGEHRIDRNALHIWPRGGYMLIALPNLDGTFTVTLFFPFTGDPSFASLDTPEKVSRFFRETFPDAVPLLPTLEEDFFANPTGSLVTVKCFPWSFGNRLVLIGDAAHAVVPFYGQGMNCGFEDCSVLDGLIEKHGHRWEAIIPEYEALRKPAADGIADLAVANFVEMRDLVGHPEFLLRKKIEGRFYERHPDKWIPLYSMVTFSHMPYHEAKRRGERQDRIMDEVMRMPGIDAAWDSDRVEERMLSLLEADAAG